MSQLDIVCFIILGVFCFLGYFKGFFTQLMGLLSLVAAYLGAPIFSPIIAEFIGGFIAFPNVILSRAALLLSGVGIFLLMHVLSRIIQKYLINSFGAAKLINRFGGALFGLGLSLIHISEPTRPY